MDLDITLLFQLGLFLVLWATLSKILLGPLLTIFEAREQKTTGTHADVERLSKLGQENMDAYQLRIREARDAAQKEHDELVTAGRTEERSIVAEARAELTKVLNAERDKVKAEEERARKELQSEADALAANIVEKIVGRKIAA